VSTDPGAGQVYRPAGLRLHRRNDRAVVGVAVAGFASGFGQYRVVAALGNVARGFGQVTRGAALADQAGLSGTELGIGLAIIASRAHPRSARPRFSPRPATRGGSPPGGRLVRHAGLAPREKNSGSYTRTRATGQGRPVLRPGARSGAR
jgi:hypothetical protein